LPCFALAFVLCRLPCVSAQDLSVIGTPQQANDRIRELSKTSKSTPHEYTIGGGDLLSISVFDVPELTRDIRVSQAGTIGVPLVPARLHVAGLTETQAKQMIADVLQANGLVSHPEVDVIVKEHKSMPITVVGAVQRPMIYEADPYVTLLEVLAAAGGISNDAGETIIVTRGHASSFFMIPIPEPNSLSPPGAAMSVPDSSETLPGAGAQEIAPSTKPEVFPAATEKAQGSSEQANSEKTPDTAIASGNIITINLNELLEKGDMRENIPLQAGDVVTVPHAGIVYVLGAVNRPGGFVMSNDRTELTTMKVLALAGGITRIAKLDHAVIIRKDDQGKQMETQVDLKKVLDQQSEDVQMRASDILYIPQSRSKEFLLQLVQISLAIATSAAIYRIGNY
jgi:protein involved in polysaccharide export with SLBB domain